MPKKGVDSFSRTRSSSLKERLFVRKERKRYQSTRARLQGTVKSGFEEESKSLIKYKFINEMTVRVHTLYNETRNPWDKIVNNSRFPWSWDTYTIVLGETEIYSPTTMGIFAQPIPYVNIGTWSPTTVQRLPFSYIKLCVGNCSYLLQAPDTYQRDRLLHSVQWKINLQKSRKALYSTRDADTLLLELQDLIKLTLESPLYFDFTNPILLEIVSDLLVQNQNELSPPSSEALIMTLAPLFEENQPSVEICNFFSKHCRSSPRSRVVIDMFLPVVLRILKYNNNYGKNLWLRNFVKEYILALSVQNNGEAAVREFVQSVHGPLSFCPHKRILNNLFAVCLSGVYSSFSPIEENVHKDSKLESMDKNSFDSVKENGENDDPMKPLNAESSKNELWETSIAKYAKSKNMDANLQNNILQTKPGGQFPKRIGVSEKEKAITKPTFPDWKPNPEKAILFAKVLDEISKINDWLPGLAVLLQPIPFQPEAMQCQEFLKIVIQILERIISHDSEKTVWCLVSVRENRDGWLQIFSPQTNIQDDDGAMFTKMTVALLKSAQEHHRVKKLIKILAQTCLNAVLLLALRETEAMIDVLCYILEFKLAEQQEDQEIVSTLRSTKTGNKRYNELCEREMVPRQTGGPVKYTLPPRSTDADLAKVLNNGKCGNLRELNLSCTQVTSKSAELISRLPLLQCLNLWSTNFDDLGLRRLCESLNLKTLNLCEVGVTDDGIISLKEMTNLTDLNLNSTKVTSSCFKELRKSLPKLAHWDVAYTDAYPEDDYGIKGSPSLAKNGLNNNKSFKTESLGQKNFEYKQNV